MTFVLCIGDFKTCEVTMPHLSVTVETSPGDLYIFQGGDILHIVQDIQQEGIARWSWIIFHHNRILQQHPTIEEPPAWLLPRNSGPRTPVSKDIRMKQLRLAEEYLETIDQETPSKKQKLDK